MANPNILTPLVREFASREVLTAPRMNELSNGVNTALRSLADLTPDRRTPERVELFRLRVTNASAGADLVLAKLYDGSTEYGEDLPIRTTTTHSDGDELYGFQPFGGTDKTYNSQPVTWREVGGGGAGGKFVRITATEDGDEVYGGNVLVPPETPKNDNEAVTVADWDVGEACVIRNQGFRDRTGHALSLAEGDRPKDWPAVFYGTNPDGRPIYQITAVQWQLCSGGAPAAGPPAAGLLFVGS